MLHTADHSQKLPLQQRLQYSKHTMRSIASNKMHQNEN